MKGTTRRDNSLQTQRSRRGLVSSSSLFLLTCCCVIALNSVQAGPFGIGKKSKALVVCCGDDDSLLEQEEDRATHVHRQLCQRFKYVEAGKRLRDVARKRSSSHNVTAVPQWKDEMAAEMSSSAVLQVQKKEPAWWQLTWRTGRLTLHFLPNLTTAWLAILNPNFRTKTWYPWLSHALSHAGPAWIKWGQWSSTRTDLFPEALCDVLETLQADAPAHSFRISQQVLAQALNVTVADLDTIFEDIDPNPIASGSIAQVHKATLCGGYKIAIKVRHPAVARLLDWDFRIMGRLAGLLDIVLPSWIRLKETVQQFSATLSAQADLNVEAANLETLNANFRKWRSVQFPSPFFASDSIILESWEGGQLTNEVLSLYNQLAPVGQDCSDVMPLDLSKFIVTTGLQIYLKMLLIDNLMHADLHPGNIIVDAPYHRFPKQREPIPDDDGHMKVSLVDAGMVTELTDAESTTFIGLLSCLGRGDAEEAADFVLRFSEENSNMTSYESFKQDMIDLFAERCRGYGTNVDVGHVLRGILTVVRNHEIRIDANFATLVINVLCVESLARRTCKYYNVLDASKPLLDGYRQLTVERNGVFCKSRLFGLWMGIRALEKRFMDRLFFARLKERRQVEALVTQQIAA